MIELYLFGSRVCGEEDVDSDFDVIACGPKGEVDDFVSRTKTYSVYYGGNLDLFLPVPDGTLWSAHDPSDDPGRILEAEKHVDYDNLKHVGEEWLLAQLVTGERA